MALWLVRSTTDCAVSGFEPGHGTLSCVPGQGTSLSVPLPVQVYKWIPANFISWG